MSTDVLSDGESLHVKIDSHDVSSNLDSSLSVNSTHVITPEMQDPTQHHLFQEIRYYVEIDNEAILSHETQVSTPMMSFKYQPIILLDVQSRVPLGRQAFALSASINASCTIYKCTVMDHSLSEN
jgi:hypothetical protein